MVCTPPPPRSDVPLAWKLLWEGFGWPLRAFAEYKNGSLMEDDAKIVSCYHGWSLVDH